MVAAVAEAAATARVAGKVLMIVPAVYLRTQYRNLSSLLIVGTYHTRGDHGCSMVDFLPPRSDGHAIPIV
jgi:hypothetical protein